MVFNSFLLAFQLQPYSATIPFLFCQPHNFWRRKESSSVPVRKCEYVRLKALARAARFMAIVSGAAAH